jgi:NADH dehydrogenase
MGKLHAVTGAFGYSGKYIARRLLAQGDEVLTLTNSTDRQNEFGGRVRVASFHFADPKALTDSLRGVDTLFNTYWVRFNHKLFTQADAVRNTKVLFNAACAAGVRRIVHVSITKPSLDSPLEYFRSKAELEQALQASGVSHAILRPTVLFGREDILINNIAWMLRHLPIVGVFGRGDYQLQPIYVEDLAELAVRHAAADDNVIVNAIGPETFTYRQLLEKIGELIGVKRTIISVPPGVGYWAARLLGLLVNDVILTRAEIEGLMANLLVVDSPPTGSTALTAWIREHRETLGRRYTSELARRRDRATQYGSN